jgi:glycosyltransferase involved in cell wall biosynthesis
MDTATKYNLAVIIPAFKPDFLAKTLESLIRQTDQQFSIYICDDASPADIESITRSVLGARPYTYKRFQNNLGRTALTKHWNRCVALADEPWIWLFGDDDLMDPGCVEAFNRFLETEGETTDLLRFDGWIVDEHDRVIEAFPVNLDNESWLEFAYGCLMGWRNSFIQQLVFRRSALQEAGGFLDLPLGFAADHAAIIAIGRPRRLRRVPGAGVYWRRSRKNIMSDRSFEVRKIKLRAICVFLQWLRTQLQKPREHLFAGDDAAFLRAMNHCLVTGILSEGFLSSLANWTLLLHTRGQVCERSRLSLLRSIAIAGLSDGVSGLGRAAQAVRRSPTLTDNS